MKILNPEELKFYIMIAEYNLSQAILNQDIELYLQTKAFYKLLAERIIQFYSEE